MDGAAYGRCRVWTVPAPALAPALHSARLRLRLCLRLRLRLGAGRWASGAGRFAGWRISCPRGLAARCAASPLGKWHGPSLRRGAMPDPYPVVAVAVDCNLPPAAHGAPPGGEAGCDGWRSETSVREAGGSSSFAHASAVGYGLRPPRDCAAVLGDQGLRNEVAGVAGPYWRPAAQRRLALLGLAALDDPGRLRSSPLPKSRNWNSHPPRSATFLAWLVEGTKKCAREGERIRRTRHADLVAPSGAIARAGPIARKFRMRARAMSTRA